MTRDEVYQLCRIVAPKYGYEPLLILALCEQESSYDSGAVRLENAYYIKYVKPYNFATTVMVLFSASYGLTQVMGDTLYQMGFFEKVDHLSVPKALDKFMVSPQAQIEAGCKWLKRKQGSDSIEVGLRRYNGSPEYPPKVMARYEKLKIAYGPVIV